MLSWRSAGASSSISLDDTTAVQGDGFTRREIAILLGAVAVLFVAGTFGFMALLDESWHAALYRTIVTASLTGLDTTPRGIGAEMLTIGVVLSGVAIFGYFAAQL